MSNWYKMRRPEEVEGRTPARPTRTDSPGASHQDHPTVASPTGATADAGRSLTPPVRPLAYVRSNTYGGIDVSTAPLPGWEPVYVLSEQQLRWLRLGREYEQCGAIGFITDIPQPEDDR